jgi:hypothetical protein
VLVPGGRAAAGERCGCGADTTKTPAAVAPSAVAVAAAPQATGRAPIVCPARPSSAPMPASRPTPTGSRPGFCQPARREARTASMIAARWLLASSPSDT